MLIRWLCHQHCFVALCCRKQNVKLSLLLLLLAGEISDHSINWPKAFQHEEAMARNNCLPVCLSLTLLFSGVVIEIPLTYYGILFRIIGWSFNNFYGFFVFDFVSACSQTATEVFSGKTGASSHPNLCYFQRLWRMWIVKVLEEERGVNSDLLNAWDWWYYVIRESLPNLCIKCCEPKCPFANWSLALLPVSGWTLASE